MNGYKVLESALALIGISEISEDNKLGGLHMINTVLDDLEMPPLTNLAEELSDTDGKALQAVLHGTAMLLCAASGDDAGRDCFSVTYHAKRMKVKNEITRVRDTLPRGSGL